jgi:hypothetical protein
MSPDDLHGVEMKIRAFFYSRLKKISRSYPPAFFFRFVSGIKSNTSKRFRASRQSGMKIAAQYIRAANLLEANHQKNLHPKYF